MREMQSVSEAVEAVNARFPLPGYATGASDVRPVAERVTQLVPAGGRLLDLGCGAMYATAIFAVLGYECTGWDDFQDPWYQQGDTLHRLMAFAERHGIAVHAGAAGDGAALPFPRESFDVVTVLDVIEHLHGSPRGLLNAAGTLLRPGGLLVVTMPNAVNLRKRLSVLVGRTNYARVDGFYWSVGQWRGHVREYTLADTVQVLRWSGFRIEQATTFNGILPGWLRRAPARSVFEAACRAMPTLRSNLLVAATRPADWQPVQADEARYRAAIAPFVPGGA